jgi:ferredoxin, 2Fe-2S
MPTVIFIERNGARREVSAEIGENLMEVARRNDVDGVVAECGGSCICATCHVYVAPEFDHILSPPEPIERDTLDFTATAVRPESRLSCQIQIKQELDGLVLIVAPNSRTA